VCIVCSIPSTSPCVLYHTGLSLEIRLRALCAHKVLTGLFSGDWFHCLCVSGLCREQLVHQLKLEEKEHEEKLEREEQETAELEVRGTVTEGSWEVVGELDCERREAIGGTDLCDHYQFLDHL